MDVTIGFFDLGVVFELRGKSFGIRDVEQSESIYSLCRKWYTQNKFVINIFVFRMYGKDDDKQMPEDIPPPLPHNVSLVKVFTEVRTHFLI